MKRYLHILITAGLLASCVQTINEESAINPPLENEFDFNTISRENLHFSIKLGSGEPLSNILIKVLDKPSQLGGEVILKTLTDENGQATVTYNLPTALDSVVVDFSYIGLPDHVYVSREQLIQGIDIYGTKNRYNTYAEDKVQNSSKNMVDPIQDIMKTSNTESILQPLGTFDSNGVPDYLMTPDVISSELLSIINASLPEGRPVPTYHPEYLSDNAETNLNITDAADVWLTFVHEGAGYQNILGFYTYPTGNPPQTHSDIDTIFIAFPNASFNGHGGGLNSGDKIHLGVFEEGQSIGFVLLANGWRESITHGIHQVYSNTILNPESTEELQQHTVLLYDQENELFLIGLEDQNRETGSDNDFNDAVFYLTANPIEAINVTNVKPIDKPIDDDSDGVNNTYDEYPNDPGLAYSYVYPGENTFGSLAFEDQWPGFGDYDFNDMVINYQFIQKANSVNKIVNIESKLVVTAVGAGFDNGFGLSLDAAPSDITTVSGQKLYENFISLNPNGTEANQSKAVIIATDNAHKFMGKQGFINTDPAFPYVTPDTINLILELASPSTLNAVGTPPYNPFIIVNKTRGREIHLPGYAPTDLVDKQYFGQGNDDSEPSFNKYYKSKAELPWAMNMPVSFDYPVEKTDVRNTYNHFKIWAESGGFSYMDWFEEKPGYRNNDKIY